jgi:1,2-dihydroxy-3-keto-5-methylthiopentene dioxygenase
MTTLTRFSVTGEKLNSTSSHTEISDYLRERGVRFEVWPTSQTLGTDSEPETILAEYKTSVDTLKEASGFKSADVIHLHPEHEMRAELRQKFLDEHTHSDDEIRFFVQGSGLFYMHFDDEVISVMCRGGDLIGVPANTKHWFDMGPEPSFTCIRLFTTPEGWVADFTGNKIAESFPRFEEHQA